MTKAYCILCWILLLAVVGQSQPNPCGTIATRSKWLKSYQQHPERFAKDNGNTIYVPMTIHLLGSDEGRGYFSTNSFLDAFCRLQLDFEEANIRFYVAGEFNYINNSRWNNHEDIPTGIEMMFSNNVENTLNVYFVSDPAGNCGYNLPYAGIANSKSCSGPNDHTWAHEVGHALTLPHPFLGWEGGVSYDGSVEHSYNNPAPREVYYDYTLFQQELVTADTIIIDTALVELMDGTNCYEAADGFCDTAPDYLSSRWNCNASTESNTTQTDPNGETFKSDASLIMSYANDNCASRFTPEQIAAMRTFLVDQRSNWLYDQSPAPELGTEEIVAEIPLDDGQAPTQGTYFEWNPVENATHYVFQLSRLATFPFKTVDTVLTTNSLTLLEDLQSDKTYYWRVRPFNNYSACNTFSTTFSFEANAVTNTQQVLALADLNVFPNLLSEGSNLQINASKAFQQVQFKLYDLQARLLETATLDIAAGNQSLPFQLRAKGVYFLEIQAETMVRTVRLVVE
ncbi:MAG: zinc-dependent metalloprotease [Bacteroidota bacterium]